MRSSCFGYWLWAREEEVVVVRGWVVLAGDLLPLVVVAVPEPRGVDQTHRAQPGTVDCVVAGLATNLISFCWLFAIKHRWRELCFSQIKVYVSCFWRCPETSTPSAAHTDAVIVSLYFWKQHSRQVKGSWRAPCQLKKPFKGLRRRLGSCW